MHHAAWILSITLLLAGVRADAQSAPVAGLHWVRLAGAEACADGSTLARAVEARAGRPVFASPSQATLSIEGTIAPRVGGRGWRVVLAPRSEGVLVGAREVSLERDDCASLTPTIALLLSLMVDPDACAHGECAPSVSSLREERPPTREQPVANATEAPAIAATPARVTPPVAQPPRWTALVGGGVALWGLLPALATSITVAGTWRPWSAAVTFELALSALLPRESAVPWDPAISVRHTGALATASACASPFRDLRITGCVGVMTGLVAASALGDVSTQEASRTLLAASVRVGFEVPLGGPLVVRLAPSLVIPLAWPQYTLSVRDAARATSEAREVTSVAAVGGSLDVMIGWRFRE